MLLFGEEGREIFVQVSALKLQCVKLVCGVHLEVGTFCWLERRRSRSGAVWRGLSVQLVGSQQREYRFSSW